MSSSVINEIFSEYKNKVETLNELSEMLMKIIHLGRKGKAILEVSSESLLSESR